MDSAYAAYHGVRSQENARKPHQSLKDVRWYMWHALEHHSSGSTSFIDGP